MTNPSNSIAEAGHQAGMINVGLAGFAVLLILALLAVGISRWTSTRPIDHIETSATERCIYYADGRAPLVECTLLQP